MVSDTGRLARVPGNPENHVYTTGVAQCQRKNIRNDYTRPFRICFGSSGPLWGFLDISPHRNRIRRLILKHCSFSPPDLPGTISGSMIWFWTGFKLILPKSISSGWKALQAKSEWKDSASFGYMSAVVAETDPIRWKKLATEYKSDIIDGATPRVSRPSVIIYKARSRATQ